MLFGLQLTGNSLQFLAMLLALFVILFDFSDFSEKVFVLDTGVYALAFDPAGKYLAGETVRTLPEALRARIAKHGIRKPVEVRANRLSTANRELIDVVGYKAMRGV